MNVVPLGPSAGHRRDPRPCRPTTSCACCATATSAAAGSRSSSSASARRCRPVRPPSPCAPARRLLPTAVYFEGRRPPRRHPPAALGRAHRPAARRRRPRHPGAGRTSSRGSSAGRPSSGTSCSRTGRATSRHSGAEHGLRGPRRLVPRAGRQRMDGAGLRRCGGGAGGRCPARSSSSYLRRPRRRHCAGGPRQRPLSRQLGRPRVVPPRRVARGHARVHRRVARGPAGAAHPELAR